MSQRSFVSGRFLSIVVLAICGLVPCANAADPPSLSLDTYAGLTITGEVGRVYTVQYTTDLAQQDGWQAAAILQLPASPYLWTDPTSPTAATRFYRALESPTNFVWIQPGSYTMGSPSTEPERFLDEGPQTVVTLTRGFFMSQFEVTQSQYLSLMNTNPAWFQLDITRPVEQVSWDDATNYCGRLTEQEQQAGRLLEGWVYRLPTEAEWEYACRAGGVTAFHYGSMFVGAMANFDGEFEYDSTVGTVRNPAGTSLGRTTTVGSYEPNAWGLYDMHGNVWEWCSNWMSENLPGEHVVNPTGPTSGFERVRRGGGWEADGTFCRSAIRIGDTPDISSFILGFRVVLAKTGG